jgi:hypothetical protein
MPAGAPRLGHRSHILDPAEVDSHAYCSTAYIGVFHWACLAKDKDEDNPIKDMHELQIEVSSNYLHTVRPLNIFFYLNWACSCGQTTQLSVLKNLISMD